MGFCLARSLGACLVPLLLALTAPVAAAEYADMPPWRALEFERKSMWGNAYSRLELRARNSAALGEVWVSPAQRDYLMPTGESIWEMTVAATVGSNQASLRLLMEPVTTAIYQWDRFTIGRKDRRNKFYRYYRSGVSRVRRDPGPDEAQLPPAQWSGYTLEDIPFPALPASSVVSNPYALLILTSSLRLGPGESDATYVHTDYNLYRVVLTRGKDSQLKTSYLLRDREGNSSTPRQSRRVETIHIEAECAGPARDKPDFDLLGLGGKVTVLVDSETRLPVRVIGIAPRVGETHLDLISAAQTEITPGE